VAEVEAVLLRADKNRTTASHNMNERSSRSHLVFSLVCQGVSTITPGKRSLGVLTLIDLAGRSVFFFLKSYFWHLEIIYQG
jgi:hypothetical protein